MIFQSQRLGIHGRDFRYRTGPKEAGPAAALLLFFFFIAVSALLAGCQTKAKINNVMVALTTVRKTVIGQLPQGLREESTNGRELTSGYFNPRSWEEDATDKSERAYAKVLILGSSRPYSIDVKVFREKRKKGGTTYARKEDRKLTKELVNRIKESLDDRREDRNIIDDFRAF